MSDVVFDEERQEIQKDSEIASARRPERFEVRTATRVTQSQNLMMVFFAIACVVAAYFVWHFKGGFYTAEPSLYREDVNEARVKLVPEFDRQQLINSLPSRDN